jgi:hypothetical protein
MINRLQFKNLVFITTLKTMSTHPNRPRKIYEKIKTILSEFSRHIF